ncbi:hypothetical protein HBH56_182150 [Parastagonospora nodorum]|nr:hypothetical protein HBH56_182150 [Parastagonospora nodorum]KAH3926109.1 hypothetical protein HBH54_171300 [Parastagonospora nodorum]KAH4133770.1 hypothetical protein HBH45_175020 [Parastagonospora nodorum]KAH4621915.1 hypothetical protein HBH55_153610 [Parastagonospora nodorum]KAH5595492.1 hypothetical protein HBI45_187760 [Parastagonospora nodorum]
MAHENTQQSVQEDHPDDNLAPANACDQCCRRKTGCSKEHPKCQRCKEDGRMCTYSIRRGAGRPRKMSKHNIDQFASSKRDLTSPNQNIALNSYSQAPQYWNEDPPLVSQQIFTIYDTNRLF